VTLPIVAVITLAEDGITTWRDYTDSRRLAEQLELG
jgi:limonene-1,2-epoxide hydrolase